MADQRKRKLEQISKHADRLTELARRYDRLRYLAEREDATEAFVDIAVAAGEMTNAALEQTATLLELIRKVGASDG